MKKFHGSILGTGISFSLDQNDSTRPVISLIGGSQDARHQELQLACLQKYEKYCKVLHIYYCTFLNDISEVDYALDKCSQAT